MASFGEKMRGMEHKTWTTADKSTWGPGPWQDEPDKEQWADPETGYACLIKRNPMGALCGYVGVPEGHPWHGSGYSPGFAAEVDGGGGLSPALRLLEEAEVHGGLTYAGSCQEGPEEHTICHVPGAGEPEHLWWLGFDCNHFMDYAPKMAMDVRSAGPNPAGLSDDQLGAEIDRWARLHSGETYKPVAYVKAECAALARQAAEAAALASVASAPEPPAQSPQAE